LSIGLAWLRDANLDRDATMTVTLKLHHIVAEPNG